MCCYKVQSFKIDNGQGKVSNLNVVLVINCLFDITDGNLHSNESVTKFGAYVINIYFKLRSGLTIFNGILKSTSF